VEPLEKISDILEVAVRIERQATALYRALARTAVSPGAQDVFAFLAAEEEKHLGVFRDLLDRAADYLPRYEYPGEYELFLDGVAHRTLAGALRSPEALKAATLDEAVAAGIDLELGAIVFYGELAALFDEKQRGPIDEIIRQEKGHLGRLRALVAL
jgi:rubrerythrin